ncbi:PA14 domain-containing protein [Saccharothrix ecbatanensis]|nr:PA14 domain-containing protein [Saccharothrix ecbatanensis]
MSGMMKRWNRPGFSRLGARWLGAGVALAAAVAVVVQVPSTSEAKPGSSLDVPLMSDDSGALPGVQWPDGDFTAAGGVPSARPNARAAGAPAAPVLASPDDGAVVASLRPQLRANALPGQVQYQFTVGTGETPDAGQVITSGWIGRPEWVVPSGVLADGGQYRWTVQARDSASGQAGSAAEGRGLVVNLRLGEQDPSGPVPTDTVGPVTVNLSTGNVTTSLTSQFMMTGFGPQFVQFTYNSLAAASSTGLTGSYFAGDAESIKDDEQPVAVRTDPQVSFFWNVRGTPPAGVGDAFRVRWQGFIRAPKSGVYDFGGIHRSGLRVWVGDQQAYDGWGAGVQESTRYGKGVRLEAGQAYPIRIDYRATGFPSFLQLWTRVDGGRTAPVPASWLSTTASVLPPGWTVSPGPGGFVAAEATESGMTLTDGKGASTAFTRQKDGSFKAASGSASLTRDDKGGIKAVSADGVTSLFDAKGVLHSMRPGGKTGRQTNNPAGGRAHSPAAAGAAPVHVKSSPATAANPVTRVTATAAEESQEIQFHYAGSDKCPDASAPAGFLCAVSLPNGALTQLSYVNGQLARLRNPGNQVTDMAFNRANQLTRIRPSTVTDWIGMDAKRRNTDAAAYLIGYQPETGRAVRVQSPEPTGSAQRPTRREIHDYAYGSDNGIDNTQVRIAGLNPPQGWARRITRDIGGRMLTDTDATGLTTEYQWAPSDEQLSRTDPTGRRSTTVAGPDGLAMYGPAPTKCFTASGEPVDPAPAGCERVPVQRMAMDPATGTMTMTTVESDGVPDKKTAVTANEFGVPLKTVLDPGGLELTSATAYDEFFRPQSITLPSGSEITYDYFGPADTAVSPCHGGQPVPQRGSLKTNKTPASADGASRIDNYFYDADGFVAGMNFGTDKWACVESDVRQRPVKILTQGDGVHADRTIESDWAVGGDPLRFSMKDEFGTITASFDLLNRPLTYTDIHGVQTTTAYDQAGRIVSQTTIPANQADPRTTITRRYDDAGRLLEVRSGDKALATSTYKAGELVSVAYANGSSLSSIGRDAAGRVTSLNWKFSDGREVVSTVQRTRAGTVVDYALGGQDPREGGPNYEYDAAGRLVEAWVNGHHYTYDYTSPSAKSCPQGTEPNAGRNNSAVRIIDETGAGKAVTDFCYDRADRLLAAIGANTVSDVKYSSAGHMAEYTLNDSRIKITYDVAERYTGVSIDGPDPAHVTYGYDNLDSVTSRTVKGSKHDDGQTLYHTNLSGTSEVLEMKADKRVLSRTVPLPGGVIASIASGSQTWRYPNVHGDIAMAAGGDGKRMGDLYTYTPYGAPLTPDGRVDADHVPPNQNGGEYAWAGSQYKRTEHAGGLSFVVQGLRQLDPLMARYHAVGTVDNSMVAIMYQYPQADPVNVRNLNGFEPGPNEPDLTGQLVGPIGGSADPPR